VQVEIGNIFFEVQLLPFRSEGNSEYTLLDTGCVLESLKKMQAFFYVLDKEKLKLAILEKTILEVEEHLRNSKRSRQKQRASSFDIDGATNNLRKILFDERIRKIANPLMVVMVDKRKVSNYKHYVEDKILAYALFEGKFKGISTKDKDFSKRLGQKYVPFDEIMKI
jgi:hypothetical protein